ncbi:hypothetical protein EES41_39530 (plasmid) [Streptomyces sp. ADI95-16]|uniref:hypothetical protein n=1 Tax=Streptomyces sp. ADI95-16 TaxID=1522758 RepID=UPI000F3A869D|nr:hypothetical protein [Streptomyces sp. ADI95-16]AYV32866.1 hypothetical protein EES41_39530 [Streptomyces sp. ADI95-16]
MKSVHLSALRESGRRAAMVGLGTAAVVGLVSSPAQASSWMSSLSNAGPGFESRRWYDTGGSTTVEFTNCTSGSSVANVTLRKDVDFQVDPQYSTASFTNCFNGYNSTSSDSWDDHGSGNYYFAVNYGGWTYLTVRVVDVYY